MQIPHWASVLKERREALGKSQAQMARDSGVLNQTELSRLERGVVHPTKDMGAAKLGALLKALGWTPSRFVQETGLELDIMPGSVQLLEGAKHLQVHLQFATFPVYHSVSAGEKQTSGHALPDGKDALLPDGKDALPDGKDALPDGKDAMLVSIPLEDLKASGASPEGIVVYLVNGDCMVSEGVRGLPQSIAPGDKVAVDTRRMPRAGDVVVAWDDKADKLLIKRFREEGEHIIFYPARHSVPPVVRHRDDPLKIIGPVVWRGGVFR